MSVLTGVLEVDWRSWCHAHFRFRLLHKCAVRPLSLEVLLNGRQDLYISRPVTVSRHSNSRKAMACQQSR